MQALMEVTKWEGGFTCSHMYWMDGDRALGYSKLGTEPPEYFKAPLRIDKRGRKFVEVADHPFVSKQTDKIIRVGGSKGAVYEVNLDQGTCTCSGFKFRGRCRHLEEIQKQQ